MKIFVTCKWFNYLYRLNIMKRRMKMTIIEAVVKVLQSSPAGLTVKEIGDCTDFFNGVHNIVR